MGSAQQHSPLGFIVEPKPNPRTNNPFAIKPVCCATTVENVVFSPKNIFRPRTCISLKLKNRIP